MTVDHNTVFASLIVAPGAVPGDSLPNSRARSRRLLATGCPLSGQALLHHPCLSSTARDGQATQRQSWRASPPPAEVQPFPESIMRWSEGFYAPAFRTVLLQDGATYGLRENDYVVGARKFGGNAQAISRGRWVHHTSFLWDYDSENMRLLRNPRRQPKYREGRGHEDFVCRWELSLAHRSGAHSAS